MEAIFVLDDSKVTKHHKVAYGLSCDAKAFEKVAISIDGAAFNEEVAFHSSLIIAMPGL